MSYTYVVTSQKPTAVKFAKVCQFTGPNDKNLIIAKGNRIEVYRSSPDGLVPEIEIQIYGVIKSLEYYRPAGTTQDVIFVLTEKKNFCIFGFDENTRKIINRATGSVKDKVGKDVECGSKGFIEPENRMIGMLLSEGLIKIIPIEQTAFKEAFNARIEELRIIDIKFLYGCEKPTICVLYEDPRSSKHIKTYHVELRDRDLTPGPWTQSNIEYGATFLIAVPPPAKGVIVVGQTLITYLNGSGNGYQSAVIGTTFFTSYGIIDADGSRYLLGDQRGNLYVLVLLKNNNGTVINISIDGLGTTSIPECISYLDNGVVYIGSVYGDSQLIRLKSKPEPAGNHIEVIDSYPNIGPILDMCVVESDKGNFQVVTCSGAFKDGSIRVIRSGIGIQEQASVDVPGIKGIWSLRANDEKQFDRYLVQSFVGETRVLSIRGEELSEDEIPGFVSEQTIFVSNVAGGLILQVTGSRAVLIDGASLQSVDTYVAPKAITIATSNYQQLTLALSGAEIILFEIDTSSRKLKQLSLTQFQNEISCLSIRPLLGLDLNASNPMDLDAVGGSATTHHEEEGSSSSSSSSNLLLPVGQSRIMAVGTWVDHSVSLLALPGLEKISTTSLGVDVQSRDILLISIEDVDYLMIGMGDGSLITFIVENEAGLPVLTGRRKFIIGTHPISFSCFINHESLCVFASCDRSTVIYSRNSKLLFSVVNVPECTGMAPFHSNFFPNCLAISSESGFMIGAVDNIQKIHIQSFYIHQSPKRICHCAISGIYSVLCQKIIEKDKEELSSSILFLSESMDEIASIELDYLEEGLSLICCNFGLNNREFIVVGTAYSIPEEHEPSRGRILVYEMNSDRRPVLLCDSEIKGAVFSLATNGEKLFAGINSQVQAFKLVEKSDDIDSYELVHECSHQGNILVLYVKVNGDYILIGDLLRSISLLQYDKINCTIEEVSRDFNSNFMRAIEIIDGDHFIGADDSSNIFISRRPLDTATEEEKTRLLIQSEYHIGEYINSFRKGSLNFQPSDQEAHKKSGQEISKTSGSYLFATVNGMIGTILTISEETFKFLLALEKSIKTVVQGVGGFSHEDWRAFKNVCRVGKSRNTIDGDLIETFLELPKKDMEVVVYRLNDEMKVNSFEKNSTSSSIFSDRIFSSVNNNPEIFPSGYIEFTVEDVLRKVEDISRMH